MKPQLLHLSSSPWSERARWALQSRRVDYQPRTYKPLLGEPELRWRLRKWSGPVSVPVLLTADGALGDSWQIAQFAARHGSGPELFPAADLARIEAWNTLSEQGLAAGRALSLARVLRDPAALAELLPPALRGVPGMEAVAAGGVRRTLAKYGASAEGNTEALAAVLEKLRDDLAHSPSTATPRTLLAEFSYADITMAQVLVFVRPPATGLKIGRANRAAFDDAALATRFADLLAWRDALYAQYRGAPPPRP